MGTLGEGKVSRRISLLGIMLGGMLLLSCSAPGASKTPSTPSEQVNSPEAELAPTNQGQTLPISAKAIVAGKTIDLEVAATPEQQAIGLMYRRSLADNRGMLFPFSPPQPVSFWMKNTLIPLDMIFLRQGVVKNIHSSVPPCKSDPCPSYGSSTEIDQVIELRAGRAAELGLKVGATVTVQKLNGNPQPPARSSP